MWLYTTCTHRPTLRRLQFYSLWPFFYLCLVVFLENDAFVCHRVSWTQGMHRDGWKGSIWQRGCKTWRDKNVTREKDKELIRTWWRARDDHFRAPLLLQGPRALWRPRVCSHACVQMALTSHPFQGGRGKWSVYSNGRRAHLSRYSAGPPARLHTRVQSSYLQESLAVVNPSVSLFKQQSIEQNLVICVCKSQLSQLKIAQNKEKPPSCYWMLLQLYGGISQELHVWVDHALFFFNLSFVHSPASLLVLKPSFFSV